MVSVVLWFGLRLQLLPPVFSATLRNSGPPNNHRILLLPFAEWTSSDLDTSVTYQRALTMNSWTYRWLDLLRVKLRRVEPWGRFCWGVRQDSWSLWYSVCRPALQPCKQDPGLWGLPHQDHHRAGRWQTCFSHFCPEPRSRWQIREGLVTGSIVDCTLSI